jgi:hypothetical protein
MRGQTIRALDQLCDVCYLTNVLLDVLPGDLASWHGKWKHAHERLSATVASLTPEEWSSLERRSNCCYWQLRAYKKG